MVVSFQSPTNKQNPTTKGFAYKTVPLDSKKFEKTNKIIDNKCTSIERIQITKSYC